MGKGGREADTSIQLHQEGEVGLCVTHPGRSFSAWSPEGPGPRWVGAEPPGKATRAAVAAAAPDSFPGSVVHVGTFPPNVGSARKGRTELAAWPQAGHDAGAHSWHSRPMPVHLSDIQHPDMVLLVWAALLSLGNTEGPCSHEALDEDSQHVIPFHFANLHNCQQDGPYAEQSMWSLAQVRPWA